VRVAGVKREDGVIRPLLRLAVALPLLGVGIGAASSAAGAGPAAPVCAQAASPNRVGVVVEHGDGQVIRRCVGFATPAVSALSALQASGLEVGIASYGGGLGAAVCQIDHEPATYPPGCFTASGSYWVLFVSHGGGAWVNSDLGASSVMVTNGDDIGFRYDPQTAADPPPPSPAGTCPAVTPTPTNTAAPPGKSTAAPRTASSAAATPTSRSTANPPSTTPTAGVLGIATPSATVAPLASLHSPASPSGVNVGLLLAAVGAGALIGLLGTRVLRRRHD
jgi:hypothetical protein